MWSWELNSLLVPAFLKYRVKNVENVGYTWNTFTSSTPSPKSFDIGHRLTVFAQQQLCFITLKSRSHINLISFVQRCNQRPKQFRPFGFEFFFPEYNAIANSGLVEGALAHGIVDLDCSPPFQWVAD